MERSVCALHEAVIQTEGGGFQVRRPFPQPGLSFCDPFLLLDEMGPTHWEPNKAIGAPAHPHRGFETVTYLLQGSIIHEDSFGNKGHLSPGGVQWMTAGDGVIHSELPEPEFKRRGGTMHGFQIWVNLPANMKRMTPRYQEIAPDELPIAKAPDGLTTVRVIAGECMGTRSLIDTVIPITMLHIQLKPGGTLKQPLPPEDEVLVYAFKNNARICGSNTSLPEGYFALFERGDYININVDSSSPNTAELLLLSAKPLQEPVARYGPFVMNSEQEVRQALLDYQSGRFGSIAPRMTEE